MKRILFVLSSLFLLAVVAFGQNKKPLTNDDVVQMTKAGFDEATIIKAVQANEPNFDTSVDSLIALKSGGVSKPVMDAMLESEARKKSVRESMPAPTIVTAKSATGQPVPDEWPAELTGMYREVGIYYKEDGKFQALYGKPVVSTHTGGILKASFTMGLSKIRSKGQVPGKHAQLQSRTRQPVFYFYMPEGQTPDSFVVVKMQEKGDKREFQVGSAGGVASDINSGLELGKVAQVIIERVAARAYRVTPGQELADGEYGFIGTLATMGVGGGEKVYDFGVRVKH